MLKKNNIENFKQNSKKTQTKLQKSKVNVMKRIENNLLMTLLPVSAIGGLMIAKFLF